MFTTRKLFNLLLLSVSLIILCGFSSSEYTRKVESLPNIPKGNPDLSLGIVVHPHSTGIDVLRDSSQNIKFTATKNYEKTDIELLRSSSVVDRRPKKFKFIGKEHSFSSDSIYEFSIMFSDDNHQWKYIRFMPFPSVIEWVTEDKLMVYLSNWAKIFEQAGWMKNIKIEQNFTLPTSKSSYKTHRYAVWETDGCKAVINVRLRNASGYKYFIPKDQRKNLSVIPSGYLVFIEIYKKSQYPDSFRH